MTTTQSSAVDAQLDKAQAFLGHIHHQEFRYRTIAIYSDPADVASAIALLNKEGFSPDQISLLGREQDGWKEKLELDWKMKHTAIGAAEGVALGMMPGVALVTGIALSGGIGVLAMGPMLSALAALGLGALGGGLIGGTVSNFDSNEKPIHLREEIEDAIGRGQWVIVVHSHDKEEAMQAQSLLPDSRIGWEPEMLH